MTVTGPKPCIYRCRCFTCGWVGYRRGYWLIRDGGPSDVMSRIHETPCPHCDAADVHGLSPRLERSWS